MKVTVQVANGVNYETEIKESKEQISDTILKSGITQVISCMAAHKGGYAHYDYKRGLRTNEMPKQRIPRSLAEAQRMFRSQVVA